jgi:hypothetical protein
LSDTRIDSLILTRSRSRDHQLRASLCQIADIAARHRANTGLKFLLMALQQFVTHFVDDALG